VLPTARLHDGQAVKITVTGAIPGSTLLAVECSPAALRIGEDGCENHRNAVFFADRAGHASTSLVVTSRISTAVGTESCVKSACLLGVVRFTSPTDDEIVGVAALSFSASACRGGTRCEGAPPVPTPTGSARGRIAPVKGAVSITPRAPYATKVVAAPATGLRSSSAITGPYQRLDSVPAVPGIGVTANDRRGEGLMQLSMDGPGTTWASDTDKAVVVSARVDAGPWQQIVLFAGSTPFTYAGFTGPLGTGRHRVSVRVDARHSTTGHHMPAVALYRVRLLVVAPSNPAYLLEKFAPVVYGRANSASSDTQLLTYGTVTSLGGGSTALSYETVWSHEDAGTSFVPFLEWGEWGRMTDITGTVSLQVSATGTISHAMYNWCGCAPPFPPNRDSLQEVSVPFHGRYLDRTHMIIRNASGNDYQSDVGTTAFRFQQPAVAGPGPREPREAVMDAHPWTYKIMDDEVRYWYLDRSTRPSSGQPGSSSQYAIISLDTSSKQPATVAVYLRLSGYPKWYRSDMGSGAPLYQLGLGRTVVKLPRGWERRTITGVRLAVYPASAASSLRVHSFKTLGLASRFRVVRIATPSPKVVPGTITVTPSQ
jgi:Neocarzinostatin family